MENNMAHKTKYIVKLSKDEREKLNKIVKTGRVAAAKRQRSQIYLYADEGPNGPSLSDLKIADKLDLSVLTIKRARQRLIEKGLEAALERPPRKNGPTPKKLDAEQEAKLVSLACVEPPKGRSRCTLSLLSDRIVALDDVSICQETVRQVLKKKKLNLGNAKNGV